MKLPMHPLYAPLSRLHSLALIQVLLAVQPIVHAQPEGDAIKDAHQAVVSAEYPAIGAQKGFRQHGVFLNNKGWAVFSLDMVSYREPPVFRNAKGKVLEFKKVLAVGGDIGLAIVELDYPESPAISLAANPPDTWQEVALVWASDERKGSYKGPILARRPLAQYGPGSADFLLLGMRLSRASTPITTGSPVINAAGDLVGVFDTAEADYPGYPMRVIAVSSGPIAALLEKAKAAPEGLPFPLKQVYPNDAAYWDYMLADVTDPKGQSPGLKESQEQASQGEEITRMRQLLAKHPESAWAAEQLLQALTKDLIMLYSQNGGSIPDDHPAAPLRDAKMEAIFSVSKTNQHKFRNHYLKIATESLRWELSGNYEKLIDLHLNELEKWGVAPPFRHLMILADAYHNQNKKEAAANYYKKIAEVAPDSLYNLYRYQRLLISLGDFDEEARIGELIERVEKAYRP